MSQTFGHASVALDVVEGLDLTGKTALVTGGSSGLGVETVKALVSVGAEIIMPVRDAQKGKGVITLISELYPDSSIHLMDMDLSDFESIKNFADDCLKRFDKIDIIINNAGIMAGPLVRMKEGFEGQFATNHLGHFLMTGLLSSALLKSEKPIVVALSSIAHRISPIVFEDIHFNERDYDKWLAYGQSKTANALFALSLDKKLKKHGGAAYSVHPGGIMTNLQKDLTFDEMNAMGWFDEDGNPRKGFKTPAGGAATAVWAATTEDLIDSGGAYLEDCSLAQIVEDRRSMTGMLPHIQDEAAAEKLWKLSEGMVGRTFDFD
ncbi:SDR family NAD(P)-dependent oxidoreductase [Kordiimonas sp. SCSIO 12610]|uniref:SDR family NAD(P)-dependent oxidoreductase n=1 Tax=Kordiimonas sp. SCSIO 12610 TaxID=2829597 RepID=UPI002109CB05|nr:SDR family NAD(P)-dependent oxidoreductase [Kordiimonas sp. SCSIO 12610]UTW54036.1 SDR family NAD(P)-dependent oxidoreductase [Kordiimonas sp. SCSIO 12610]